MLPKSRFPESLRERATWRRPADPWVGGRRRGRHPGSRQASGSRRSLARPVAQLRQQKLLSSGLRTHLTLRGLRRGINSKLVRCTLFPGCPYLFTEFLPLNIKLVNRNAWTSRFLGNLPILIGSESFQEKVSFWIRQLGVSSAGSHCFEFGFLR